MIGNRMGPHIIQPINWSLNVSQLLFSNTIINNMLQRKKLKNNNNPALEI